MDSIVIPVVTLNMIGIGVIAAIALGTKQPRGMKKRYAGIDTYDIDGDVQEIMVQSESTTQAADEENAGIPSKQNTFRKFEPPTPIVVTDNELSFVYVILTSSSDGKCILRRDTPGPDEDVTAVVKRVVSTTDGVTAYAPANLTISFLLAIPITKASTILHDIGKQLVEKVCDKTEPTWLHDPMEPGATLVTPAGNIGLCIGMTSNCMVLKIRESDAKGSRMTLASKIARDGIVELLRAKIARADDEAVDFLFSFPCEWMQLSDARRLVEQVLKTMNNPDMLRLRTGGDAAPLIIHMLRVDQPIKDDGSLRAAMRHANDAAKAAGFDDDDEPNYVVFRSSSGTGCHIDDARAARLQRLNGTAAAAAAPATGFNPRAYGIIECAHEYVSSKKTGRIPTFTNKFVAAFMSDDGIDWTCEMFIDPGPKPAPTVVPPLPGAGAPGAGAPGAGAPGAGKKGKGKKKGKKGKGPGP